MARPGSGPPTGSGMSPSQPSRGQPSDEDLRRRCLEILDRISPVGQQLTPEDERLAGLIARPGEPTEAIAPLGRPLVTVDARGIITGKRCC